MSDLGTKAWQAIAPEIGWDPEDPQGPSIGRKAMETLRVNDFGQMAFGAKFEGLEPERCAAMVKALAEKGLSFMSVGEGDSGLSSLWASSAGFALIMKNRTKSDDPKSVPQTDS